MIVCPGCHACITEAPLCAAESVEGYLCDLPANHAGDHSMTVRLVKVGWTND